MTIIARTRRFAQLVLGAPGSAAELRLARIGRAALSAVAGRGVSILVSLVSIPLTVGYLGPERFGAWTTLSSFLAWFQIADLGIGNGLTNALSRAYGRGRDDEARAYVATSLALLGGLAAALVLLVLACAPFVDWGAFFNVRTELARAELQQAVEIALVLFLCGFPLAVIDRVYLSYQEGLLSNGWAAATNLMNLAAIVIATRLELGMTGLVVATGGTRLAVGIVSGAWLFARHRPGLAPRWRNVDLGRARELLRAGVLFFAVQVAALVLYNSDNVIISKVLGPEQVTPYAVAWRLLTIPSAIIGLVFPYLWPAYGEALARGDHGWVRRTAWRSAVGAAILGLSISVPMVLFGKVIIRRWAGAPAVPTQSLLVWMGVWSVIAAAMSAVACLLNAMGRLRGQALYGLVTATANVALSIVLARRFGSVGVIAATVLTYAASSLVPSCLEALRALRELAPDLKRSEDAAT